MIVDVFGPFALDAFFFFSTKAQRCIDRGRHHHFLTRPNSLSVSTPGGGDSHMKEAGMLVVSLRSVNFGFWSHLGCSGQKLHWI